MILKEILEYTDSVARKIVNRAEEKNPGSA